MKLESLLILVVTFVIVYWEAAFDGFRRILGAQPDLLPSIIVYAALTNGLWLGGLAAITGGLMFDSLSANPLGVSSLPLFLAAFCICGARDLIVRDQPFAQMVLGAGAAALTSFFSLLILLSSGEPPQVGWGTLWHLVVMIAGAAAATPLWFILFQWLHRTLEHERLAETSFRSDREIRRGRK